MIKQNGTKLLITLVFVFLSFVILNSQFIHPKVLAYETSCPSSMSDQDCLEFLNQQSALINAEKNEVEASLESEEEQQESLSQQINYLSYTIQKTELTILELEIEIARANTEINILGEQISKIQNNVDTLTQEINILQEAIIERTKVGYKLSLISPITIILDSNSFETKLRKIKYIISIKSRDRDVLENMSLSRTELQSEENKLAENRVDEQEKRNEMEENRENLAHQRDNLAQQKAQQQVLYAESQDRAEDLQSQLNITRKTQSSLDAKILALLTQLYEQGGITFSGWAPKGAAIGRMGNTGYSTGPHLHFSINDGDTTVDCSFSIYTIRGYFCGTVDPWSGYLNKGPDYWYIYDGWKYYFVRSGSMQIPLDGPSSGPAVITQNYHQGTAIDLFSLYGEGAYVYAAWSGTIASGGTAATGKYVLLKHDNGWVTFYLHLQ